MKEGQPRTFLETFGTYARNGGIIAGLIGLLISGKLAIFGFSTGGLGEIIRRAGKKKEK